MAKTSRDSRRYRIQMSAMEGESLDNVIIRENNVKIVKEALDHAMAAALEEIGLVAEAKAKKLCPVDTGRLRNSITHAIDSVRDKVVYIGTNVEYAPYVENGTSRRKGVHFLRRAAQENADRYRAIVRKHLEGS